VEDEEMAREMFCEALAMEGYTALSAPDREQAVAALEGAGGRIDLLLTDVILPTVRGSELAEQLRARFPGLRVLYMSGYPADAITHSGVLAEGVPFLQKPFTPDELVHKVREVLDAS
jgi:DNA-binding response OmpR family regulator